MNIFSTIMAYRRLTFMMIMIAFAHLLLVVCFVFFVIKYQQLWAIAAVLWLPLIILALRWTAGMLTKFFLARDDDVLAVNGVVVSPAADDFAREKLANIVEEIAVATGELQPDVAVCQSKGINAFIAYPEKQGQNQPTIVFTSAMISELNRYELQAVVANLYSHRRNFEQMFVTMAGTMYIAVFATADLFLISSILYWNFGGSDTFSTGMIVLLVMGMIAAPVLASGLAQVYVIRHARFLDDLKTLEITNDPENLISALETMSQFKARFEASYETSNAHFYFDAVKDPDRKFPWQRLASHPQLLARLKDLKVATSHQD